MELCTKALKRWRNKSFTSRSVITEQMPPLVGAWLALALNDDGGEVPQLWLLLLECTQCCRIAATH